MIKLEDPCILNLVQGTSLVIDHINKYFKYNFCVYVQLSTGHIIANWAITNILLLQSKWRF